jgi:hypothetical protein
MLRIFAELRGFFFLFWEVRIWAPGPLINFTKNWTSNLLEVLEGRIWYIYIYDKMGDTISFVSCFCLCLLTEKHFLALWNMNSQTLSAASLPFYVEDIAPLSLLIVIIIFASWGQLEFLMCRVFFLFFSFSCVKLIV